MSFFVLVIPEDPLQNGHILAPLVRALMRDVGRPNAKVKVLTQPRVRGYDQAVKAIRDELYANYGFMDLWLFETDTETATSRMQTEPTEMPCGPWRLTSQRKVSR